jgi:hypothetical protein
MCALSEECQGEAMSKDTEQVKLSWEKNHPERALWTSHTIGTLKPHLQELDIATDIVEFVPKYKDLTDEQRMHVWAELVSGVALFESGWKPCDRFLETKLGIDKLTGEPVYSERLLQLSYQDVLSYPNLPFDWGADKFLARADCGKTILDPLKNLTGGIALLAQQIRKQHAIVLKHPYWSTLGEPSVWRDSKAAEIRAMVRKLPFAI